MIMGATSPISAAIVAVIVLIGETNEFSLTGSTGAFPVTIITAMVSPIARPMPNMMAVRTPLLAAGNVTFQIVCQGVAPNARAASR